MAKQLRFTYKEKEYTLEFNGLLRLEAMMGEERTLEQSRESGHGLGLDLGGDKALLLHFGNGAAGELKGVLFLVLPGSGGDS